MSNLAFDALLRSVADAAKRLDVQDFRVSYKRNAKGEMVVAIIIKDTEGPFSRYSLDE